MRLSSLLSAAALLGATLVSASPAAPAADAAAAVARRDPVPAGGQVDFYSPLNRTGGHMLTILPDSPLGEPINVIISGRSSKSVLSIEGFLLWATSVHFGVSCLGQANGTQQLANLGDGLGNRTQGSGDGNNGVLRWNYYDPYIGTCRETLIGGNHFRWWKQDGPQANSGAFFLAVSNEGPLSVQHEIVVNGYNTGRDELVGNATFANGTTWQGNYYQATVEWIEAGVLLNDSSFGINHAPRVNPPGGEAQDGRVALLTVIQTVVSPEATNLGVATDAAPRSLGPSMLALSFSAALLLGVALLQ